MARSVPFPQQSAPMTDNVLPFARRPNPTRPLLPPHLNPYWLADALNMRDEEGRVRDWGADEEKR